MAIKPLDDRVVLKILDAEETTAGGIVLPDTAKEKPQKGTVTAVGAGRLLDGRKLVGPVVEILHRRDRPAIAVPAVRVATKVIVRGRWQGQKIRAETGQKYRFNDA